MITREARLVLSECKLPKGNTGSFQKKESKCIGAAFPSTPASDGES